MKKGIFIAIFLGFTVVSPIYAQTAPDSTPTVQNQYVQALQQVISLLEQQVAQLVIQLQSLSANQTAITAQLQTITQNTTPVSQVFGSTTPAPVDKSAILVTVTGPSNKDPINSAPYGTYGFTPVSVLDKDGNYVKNASVIVSGLTDDVNLSQRGGTETRYTINHSTGNINIWDTGFSYTPQTPGIKTIIFTSGDLSTTTSIIVQ